MTAHRSPLQVCKDSLRSMRSLPTVIRTAADLQAYLSGRPIPSAQPAPVAPSAAMASVPGYTSGRFYCAD